MVTPAVKREAVVHLCSAFEVSERRACSMIEVPRMTVRYRSRRPDEARGRLISQSKLEARPISPSMYRRLMRCKATTSFWGLRFA
jgi:hypothetical protein